MSSLLWSVYFSTYKISYVEDLNARNKCLTAKLLKQGYQYHKLRKVFFLSLLHQGLSEPEFYGDLVYKFKKIMGRTDFSDQFRKKIIRHTRFGYDLNVMRQSAC